MAMPSFMYTPHPADDWISRFVASPLIAAGKRDYPVAFRELLELRRAIEELASQVEIEAPDLIPFFATGGIPLAFPAMQLLYDRRVLGLVDGSRFHMFPGLAWQAQLGGADSEAFFVEEFSHLLMDRYRAHGSVKVLSFDATRTGNALNKLLKAIYLAFQRCSVPPSSASVKLIAVLDTSRASHEQKEGVLKFNCATGPFYLAPPQGFEPDQTTLLDRAQMRFVRSEDNNLFDLDIAIWSIPTLPMEDQYELIGAQARTQELGTLSKAVRGRLTIEFENGYSSSGTGGGSVAHNILNALSKPEDKSPWREWKRFSSETQLSASELDDYLEGKRQTSGALIIFECLESSLEDIVSTFLDKQHLLLDVEIYCLKEKLFEQMGRGDALQAIPDRLMKKVIKSAKNEPLAAQDALIVLQLSRPELLADEPQDRCEADRLDWWAEQLRR